MNKTTTTLLALAASLACATGAGAADLESGRRKAETVCAACHGKDGNTPIDPSYPKLAGQHEDYLRHALHDYKDGERKNPIMAAQAQALSKQDMADVAAYFASLPGKLSHRK